jgi:hypothetical protein
LEVKHHAKNVIYFRLVGWLQFGRLSKGYSRVLQPALLEVDLSDPLKTLRAFAIFKPGDTPKLVDRVVDAPLTHKQIRVVERLLEVISFFRSGVLGFLTKRSARVWERAGE